jgi:hypothetical protein
MFSLQLQNIWEVAKESLNIEVFNVYVNSQYVECRMIEKSHNPY